MSKKSSLSNTDFIPLALFELGGIGKFIDVEHIFKYCYDISPERFGWRKYKYPNYKILYQALIDFDDKHPGLIIKTPDGLSRQLSSDGVNWIRRRISFFSKFIDSPTISQTSRRPNQRIINEIANHPLYRAYSDGNSLELDKYEVADLMLCSPDSPVALWNERLETYKSTAEDSKRHDILKFLNFLFDSKPDWFGGV